MLHTYVWQLGIFFSADPSAQNSRELHFHIYHKFIYPTISALVGSLCARDEDYEMKLTRLETRELIYKVRWFHN